MYLVNIKAPLHKGGKSRSVLLSHIGGFSNKSNVLLRGVSVCVCGAPMHPMRLDHLCAMYPAVTLPGSLAAGTCGALVLSAQGEL